MSKSSDTETILKTIINIFYFVIETTIPDADEVKFKVGEQIGKQLAKLFESNELEPLIEEIKEFWLYHGFGEIRDFHKEGEKYKVRVYECYECKDMPNMGKPVCKVDEGVFTSILTIKLKRQFMVEEIQCMAMGCGFCEFDIMGFDKDEEDSPFGF